MRYSENFQGLFSCQTQDLDDLLDKFEKAQASTRRNLEDREWLDSPPVGRELL